MIVTAPMDRSTPVAGACIAIRPWNSGIVIRSLASASSGTSAGLDVHDLPNATGKQAFKLPCVCWDEKCTIYPNRPNICGSYRCHLLQKLDKGDVDLGQALEKVRRTKSLVSLITSELGEKGKDLPLWDRIVEFRKGVPGKGSSLDVSKAEHSTMLLNVGMLLASLKDFEPDLYSKEVPGGSEMASNT